MLYWSLNKFALFKTRSFFITLKDIATTKYHVFQNTLIYYSETIGTPVFYFPIFHLKKETKVILVTNNIGTTGQCYNVVSKEYRNWILLVQRFLLREAGNTGTGCCEARSILQCLPDSGVWRILLNSWLDFSDKVGSVYCC